MNRVKLAEDFARSRGVDVTAIVEGGQYECFVRWRRVLRSAPQDRWDRVWSRRRRWRAVSFMERM